MDTWENGPADSLVDIMGMTVSLNSKNGAELTSGPEGTAVAYGIVSDVSNVDVQLSGQSTRGFKTSAIFMGDVGIGREPHRPSTNIYPDLSHPDALIKLEETYVLEVNGAIVARHFFISDSLIFISK